MAESFLRTVVIAANEYAIGVENIAGNEYGWDTVTTTSTTPAPGPENICNRCDPAIPDDFFVTLGTLPNCYDIMEGKHEVSWIGGCKWQKEVLGIVGVMYCIKVWPIAGRWWGSITWSACESAHHLDWDGGVDECDPTDAYSFQDCHGPAAPADCDDSCDGAAAATFVVSYV